MSWTLPRSYPRYRAVRAGALGFSSSLLVTVVDTLAKQRMVGRRRPPQDRRVQALYLTTKGRQVVADILQEAAAHEDQLCPALAPPERTQLIELLTRVAADRGLTNAVHPGFADKTGKMWGRGANA
jgi:hypothetical protein